MLPATGRPLTCAQYVQENGQIEAIAKTSDKECDAQGNPTLLVSYRTPISAVDAGGLR